MTGIIEKITNFLKRMTSKVNPMETSFMKKLFSKIDNSTKDHLGKDSASRIGYYIFISMILMITLTVIGVEAGNAYVSWKAIPSVAYTISNELLALLGMLIAQLSILLNIKKNSEKTSFPTLETTMGIKPTEVKKPAKKK